MRVFDAQAVAVRLDYSALVDVLRDGFRDRVQAPVRYHHEIETANGPAASLLLMPAWKKGGHVGVKVTTVCPGNSDLGLPSVHACYLLFQTETGEPVALMDGGELTARRTAAASALASRYLSRPNSRCLLMMGTGRLARHLIAAHATQRPLDRVMIWGRTPEKASKLARDLGNPDQAIEPVTDLESAMKQADIVSCATLARSPIIQGRWLRSGQHVDLVGGFTPEMREADDEVMIRGMVFVDTRVGALSEAGDLLQPIGRGAMNPEDVRGDLFDLAEGRIPGRRSESEITVFKSVGTALEDLAAAGLVLGSDAGGG